MKTKKEESIEYYVFPKSTKSAKPTKTYKLAWKVFKENLAEIGWYEFHAKAIRKLGFEPHLPRLGTPPPGVCPLCGCSWKLIMKEGYWFPCVFMPYLSPSAANYPRVMQIMEQAELEQEAAARWMEKHNYFYDKEFDKQLEAYYWGQLEDPPVYHFTKEVPNDDD